MTRLSRNTALAVVSCLVCRRGRRATWAYVLWLIPYLLTAWLFAGELAFHSGARPYQMLSLLIPFVRRRYPNSLSDASRLDSDLRSLCALLRLRGLLPGPQCN